MNDPLVYLVTALPAEAKPVASWFNLKRVLPESAFPVFRNEHVALTVSGVGKLNAAAATAFLFARFGCPRDRIWVNLGIAGHANLDVGTPLLAHCVEDTGSGRRWYPPFAVHAPCATEALQTLDRADFDYARQGAFDMEASGFYGTAVRFSTAELVHCLKLVSDNAKNPGQDMNAEQVYALVGSQLDVLDELLERLGWLANQLHEARVPEELLSRYRENWHFTESQRHQLRDLLARWNTLAPTADLWPADTQHLRDAKAVLRQIRRHIDESPVLL